MAGCFGMHRHLTLYFVCATQLNVLICHSLLSKLLFVSERLELNGDDQYVLFSFLQNLESYFVI
jgi:hypothetical protein